MKINFVLFLTLIGFVFFLVSLAPVSAQELDPDQFDISGFRLGDIGGPDLKKAVESLPEGYTCLDVYFEGKPAPGRTIAGEGERAEDEIFMGYSCFAPEAPSNPYKMSPSVYYSKDEAEANYKILNDVATQHLLLLFDEDDGKIWFISKVEKFNQENAPLFETMQNALTSKYGPGDNGRWAFDKNGNKTSPYGIGAAMFPIPFLSLDNKPVRDIPTNFYRSGEKMGIYLDVRFSGCISEGNTCNGYSLILYDHRPRYAREVASKARAAAAEMAEEERKKNIVAPKF